MIKATFILILINCSSQAFGDIFFTKLHQQFESSNHTSCTILAEELILKQCMICQQNGGIIDISTHPNGHLPEGMQTNHSTSPNSPTFDSFVIEIYSKNRLVAFNHIDKICTTSKSLELEPSGGPPILSRISRAVSSTTPQVSKLIDTGDSSNRIDVVFMGDGYTLSEKDKFFQDINRLIKETFEIRTFRNFLPLFNIWAIFVPSKDSGIGYKNQPRNTPFKLFRSGGVLRGIFTKNAKFARQVCKLTGPSGCDYPSLIANDDFYGGLGGEFAISTRSLRTGSMVLRHEFGHNFGKIGEEYDSGVVYTGANSASSLRNLKWKSWLTNKRNASNSSPQQIKEERLIYRILEYPTNDLDKRPLTFVFKSDGSYSRWHLFVSVSGAGETDSLKFLLDGEPLPWKSRGFDDKEFYDWFGDKGFTQGRHNLSITSTSTLRNITRTVSRMVGLITLYEYGNEEEFHLDVNYISVYPTWDFSKKKSYRPTNAGCLMRNMTHDHFCSVCKEEIWLQFFKRISLIDSLIIEKMVNNTTTMMRNITLKTLKLGQFREPGTEVKDERLEIKWFKDGKIIAEGCDQLTLTATDIAGGRGFWSVEVKLITPEVRNDPKKLLSSVKRFKL